MKNSFEVLGVFFAAVAMLAFFAALLAWPTQLLWNNCLVPAIEGINEIGFFQALGINFLFSVLFKNSTSTKNG